MTAFSDAAGQEYGHILYDPLGNVIENTLPSEMVGTLAGNLDATGLQFDGRRYYDSLVGGYTQPLGSSIGGNQVDLWGNPYVAFGLNKALIGTGLEGVFPPGLAEYRVGRHIAPLLRQTPDFLTIGFGYEQIRTVYTVGAFHPRSQSLRYPNGVVTREVVDEFPVGFKLWGSLPSDQIRTDFRSIVAIRYEGYRHTVGAGKLLRAGAKNLPLFGLDVGFNAYFQYQDEAHLPKPLRIKRAIAGGSGNAVISGGIAGGAGLATATVCVGTIVETLGIGCAIAIGVTALGIDFGLNYAFDEWGYKDDMLEFFGWGQGEYDKSHYR